MDELKNKKVLVIGLGKSGVAAARFRAARGCRVVANDRRTDKELGAIAATLANYGIEVKLGHHDTDLLAECDFVVPSPGVPNDIPLLAQARRKKKPVMSEMELALAQIRTPIVAVTGTNGKTTTTALISHLLAQAGVEACTAGNIGTPLVDVIDRANASEWLVLEVSSFQIETTPSLSPKIAVLLNVTPDHLDRHGSVEAYAAVKGRLLQQVGPDGFAIFNAGNDGVRRVLESQPLRCIPIPFDRGGDRSSCRGWARGGRLSTRTTGKHVEEWDVRDVRLVGGHNQENMLAALLAVQLCGADVASLRRGLASFSGLPHRLQFVREVGGVQYFDDSKGTNVDATLRALESFTQPVVLIAGGQPKEENFTSLRGMVRRHLKRLIVMGEAKGMLKRDLSDVVPTEEATSMRDAVALAQRAAKRGDVVLLSPACASFDMFRDYADRGDAFIREVERLMTV